MALYNAFPPHRLHSSRPIAPSQALDILSNYLDAAATNAYLQPNALLTETGPVSSIQGAHTSLALHNLKRIQAGLRGEHLGADLTFAQFGGEGLPDLQVEHANGIENNHVVDTEGQAPDASMGTHGWQDLAEYEREQDVVAGDVGDRGQDVVEQSAAKTAPEIGAPTTAAMKQFRKQRKKEKRQQEKRERETGRKKNGSASVN